MGDKNPIRTIRDYSKPSYEGYRNTIKLPVGNNVVPLRSDTIRLVQNGCSFHGLRSEDPNQHLKDFLKLVDSLNLDVANRERMTAKLRNDILMFQQHQGESLSEAMTRFKDLLQKFPHYGINLSLQVQIFYDHVNPAIRRTIDQSAGDVPSTSDRRLIELENQVQCLMEAHLAPKQHVQVNKISSSCEICSGPHDTQYCIENPKQAFVNHASSRNDKVGGKQFTMNQGPRNFNEAANAWKEKSKFNWARIQTFRSPQNGSFSTYSSSYQMKLEKALSDFNSRQERRLPSLETQLRQQQDDMINKINTLWRAISEKLNDTPTPDTTGNSMAHINAASIDHVKKKELRSKGIKIPSKLLSLKYWSQASLEERNMNPSS
ncbi:hypothetical protein Tco_0549115 [Tanacetum coccineum]